MKMKSCEKGVLYQMLKRGASMFGNKNGLTLAQVLEQVWPQDVNQGCRQAHWPFELLPAEKLHLWQLVCNTVK
jgi:hypothetical protein